MTSPSYALLPARGLIAVKGDDARSFLQGLVSNDVRRVGPDHAIHAAFLTAQGKFLHDFFMVEAGNALLLECEAGRLDDLMRRLGIYKLRAKVELRDASGDDAVAVLFGDGAAAAVGLDESEGSATPFGGGIAYVDPRLAAAGVRLVLPRASAEGVLRDAGFPAATVEDYDALRLRLGLPDGSRDLEVEKAILLENGFEELHGVDFEKGCFMGQELTARTKYRALIKKRLVPVDIDGPLPPPGTPVIQGGKEIGEMRSGQANLGLAVLRLDAIDGTGAGKLTAGKARLTPRKPDWASF